VSKVDFAVVSCDSRVTLALGEDIGQVQAVLGVAPVVEVFANESDTKWDVLSHRYPDVWIEVYREFPGLQYVFVRQGCWQTPRGVRIGDPVSKVVEEYKNVQRLDSGDLYVGMRSPEEPEAPMAILFVVKDSVIAQIAVMIAPD
jgi:hypothetical protein